MVHHRRPAAGCDDAVVIGGVAPRQLDPRGHVCRAPPAHRTDALAVLRKPANHCAAKRSRSEHYMPLTGLVHWCPPLG